MNYEDLATKFLSTSYGKGALQAIVLKDGLLKIWRNHAATDVVELPHLPRYHRLMLSQDLILLLFTEAQDVLQSIS